MKQPALVLATVALLGAADVRAQAPTATPPPSESPLTQPVRPTASFGQQQRIAPGMAGFTDDVLFGDVWRRPELSPRDRSLVTVSVLIATGKTAQLEGHLGRALDNGVLPSEASGILAHLAFYSGWPSAVSALDVFERVFTARKVDTASLRAIAAPLAPPPFDEAQARAITDPFGGVAPKFTQLTNDVVLGILWRRADLKVRDRSIVTLAALAGMGDDDQLEIYLRRAIDSGLTRDQISEAFTHLAFYAGWPKATKALTVTRRVLGSASPSAASTSEPVPSGNFTGSVSVTDPFRGSGGARVGGAKVTFEVGARTRWHIHPLGQLLVVTAGRGWVQIEGEPVRLVSTGDVVWTPPGTKHWHGATRTDGMTHVAVAESQEGSSVTWLERVSDAAFQGPVGREGTGRD